MKKLVGVGVSKGLVVEKAYTIYDYKPQIVQKKISPMDLDREYARFLSAVESSKVEIKEAFENLASKKKHGVNIVSEILDISQMLLEDVEFQAQVKGVITQSYTNAEWAVKKVIQSFVDKIVQNDEAYLADRVHDLNEVGMRIIYNLSNTRQQGHTLDLTSPCIVVSNNLYPSQLLKIKNENLKGIILQEGGATSHVVIIAKAYGIPMIIDVENALEEIPSDSEIILNASEDTIIVKPDESIKKEYVQMELALIEKRRKLFETLKTIEHKRTKDDIEVSICLNVDVVEELTDLTIEYADGIGLFRSEFLLEQISKYHDSENEQYEIYKELVTRMKGKLVTIRTFDAGGDKLPVSVTQINEENPLLGYRGVRYCLGDKDFFLTQLKAILRVSALGKVRILIPMVSCIDEMMRIFAFIKRAKSQLSEKGIKYDENIEVGIMIEVPSILYIMDDIADYCDFYSIGTNDLLQYTMATDRGNSSVSDLYSYYHPPFLRMLNEIFYTAHEQKKELSICGEMAAVPELIPLLLGMGLRNFSVSPNYLPNVIVALSQHSIDNSRDLLEKVLSCKTSREVIRKIEEYNNEVSGNNR